MELKRFLSPTRRTRYAFECFSHGWMGEQMTCTPTERSYIGNCQGWPTRELYLINSKGLIILISIEGRVVVVRAEILHTLHTLVCKCVLKIIYNNKSNLSTYFKLSIILIVISYLIRKAGIFWKWEYQIFWSRDHRWTNHATKTITIIINFLFKISSRAMRVLHQSVKSQKGNLTKQLKLN